MTTPFILSEAKDLEPTCEARSSASLHQIPRAYGAKDKFGNHEKTS